MLKKVLKLTGKLLKVYLILDMLCWSYIGLAEWFHYMRKYGTRLDVYEGFIELYEMATYEWKKFLNIK